MTFEPSSLNELTHKKNKFFIADQTLNCITSTKRNTKKTLNLVEKNGFVLKKYTFLIGNDYRKKPSSTEGVYLKLYCSKTIKMQQYY